MATRYFQNQIFPSFNKLCAHYKQPESRVRRRLNIGWTLEEALGVQPKKSMSNKNRSKPRAIEMPNGEILKFPSLKDAAKHFRLDYHKVHQRMTRWNWSIEQALGIVSPPKRKAHNSLKIEVADKIFESHTDCAEYYGLSHSLISKRISEGWTVSQAVELEPAPVKIISAFHPDGTPRLGQIYKIVNLQNGKAYVGLTVGDYRERFSSHVYLASGSASEASLERAIFELGKDAFTVELIDTCPLIILQEQERLSIKKHGTLAPKGYNLNRGGAGFSGRQIDLQIPFEGCLYQSLSDLARSKNVKPATLHARIREGKSLEEAIEGSGRRTGPMMFKGVHYESRNHLARAHNLKPATLQQRLKDGWSLEDAVEIPAGGKNRYEVIHEGKAYTSLGQLAKAHNMKPATLLYRVNKLNMSLYEALKQPVRSPKDVEFEGKVYSNVAEAARAAGLKPHTVHCRILNGMTIDEALRTPLQR